MGQVGRTRSAGCTVLFDGSGTMRPGSERGVRGGARQRGRSAQLGGGSGEGQGATVQAESDGNGNGGRRNLSPSQSHLRAHSQQGEAGATPDHQQQQQEEQPSTTMAVLVGAALGMMAIGLVMGLVQLIRSAARASSSSALLPTAAVTL